MREAEISKALAGKAFRDAVAESEGAAGVDFIEIGYRSGSMFLGRFLSYEDAWIKQRHPYFDSAVLQFGYRVLYLLHLQRGCQVGVSVHMGEYQRLQCNQCNSYAMGTL